MPFSAATCCPAVSRTVAGPAVTSTTPSVTVTSASSPKRPTLKRVPTTRIRASPAVTVKGAGRPGRTSKKASPRRSSTCRLPSPNSSPTALSAARCSTDPSGSARSRISPRAVTASAPRSAMAEGANTQRARAAQAAAPRAGRATSGRSRAPSRPRRFCRRPSAAKRSASRRPGSSSLPPQRLGLAQRRGMARIGRDPGPERRLVGGRQRAVLPAHQPGRRRVALRLGHRFRLIAVARPPARPAGWFRRAHSNRRSGRRNPHPGSWRILRPVRGQPGLAVPQRADQVLLHGAQRDAQPPRRLGLRHALDPAEDEDLLAAVAQLLQRRVQRPQRVAAGQILLGPWRGADSCSGTIDSSARVRRVWVSRWSIAALRATA